MKLNKKTVFIGGCPRSGTTMLGSMLGSTKHCIATPESHFKQKIPIGLRVNWLKGISKKEVIDALLKNFRFKIWEIPIPDNSLPSILTRQDYRDLIFQLVDSYARKVGKSNWNVWIDHTPQNFQNALMLLDIFPKAKFVHIVRDPRAVAASVIPLDWGPNTADDAAIFWAQKLSYALAFESISPERCFKVRYEDIVRHPEKVVKEICNFTDIEFKSSMILGKEFRIPNYSKTQHALIGKAPNLERINSWKTDLTDLQIYQIEKFCEDLLDMMGYTKMNPRPVRNIIRKMILRIKKGQVIDIIKKRRFTVKKKMYGK